MRAWSLAMAVSVAGTSACVVRHELTVSGETLRRSMAERHARGQVQVMALHWRDGRRVGHRKVIITDGQVLGLDGGQVSLAELERGCVDPPPAEGAATSRCPLDEFANAQFEVHRYRTREFHTAKVVGVVVTVGLVGMGVCGFKCPDDSVARDVSLITLGTLGAVVAGAMVWAIVDCLFIHGLGSPGCRD